MLRTYEGRQICAPVSELPSNISTMRLRTPLSDHINLSISSYRVDTEKLEREI